MLPAVYPNHLLWVILTLVQSQSSHVPSLSLLSRTLHYLVELIVMKWMDGGQQSNQGNSSEPEVVPQSSWMLYLNNLIMKSRRCNIYSENYIARAHHLICSMTEEIRKERNHLGFWGFLKVAFQLVLELFKEGRKKSLCLDGCNSGPSMGSIYLYSTLEYLNVGNGCPFTDLDLHWMGLLQMLSWGSSSAPRLTQTLSPILPHLSSQLYSSYIIVCIQRRGCGGLEVQ